jgi:inhibitor of KinA
VVPTYRSATVYVDPLTVELGPLTERLRVLAEGAPMRPAAPARTIEIPVAYGGECGPDLSAVAAFAGLSVEEAVALHHSVAYRCYMLGFSPGFPYLGRVPEAIAMPRLSEPRARVPAGSVGIAGSQTGIYPHDSPGGWRLIGRTPLRLYDPGRTEPFLIRAGDQIRFVPIDRQTYDQMVAVSSGQEARG